MLQKSGNCQVASRFSAFLDLSHSSRVSFVCDSFDDEGSEYRFSESAVSGLILFRSRKEPELTQETVVGIFVDLFLVIFYITKVLFKFLTCS